MIAPHLPATRRAGSKPFLVEGLNAETGEWEAPAAGQRYGELQAGVQLANRTGALNEIEYSEFVQKVQAFADAIGAMADFPDMLDVVARARELDAFASQHDAQLAVHLRARGAAWSVGYIQQHARAPRLRPRRRCPGRLVCPATEEGAPPVLTLTFDSQAALADDPDRAAVRDVDADASTCRRPTRRPSRSRPGRPRAQALAVGMDAAIVDDHGRPLSAAGLRRDRRGARPAVRALEARDLAAGSAAARRLFS